MSRSNPSIVHLLVLVPFRSVVGLDTRVVPTQPGSPLSSVQTSVKTNSLTSPTMTVNLHLRSLRRVSNVPRPTGDVVSHWTEVYGYHDSNSLVLSFVVRDVRDHL